MTDTTAQDQRWVRVPGPGQIRGEGEWELLELSGFVDSWEWLKHTEFLPTHVGPTPPEETSHG